MRYPYQRYRLIRPDGSTIYVSIPANVDAPLYLSDLMARHGVTEAELLPATRPPGD